MKTTDILNTTIIKRDGTTVDFDPDRIRLALTKAQNMTGEEIDLDDIIDKILDKLSPDNLCVEQVSDITEQILKEEGYEKTYNEFFTYRRNRTRHREANSKLSNVIKAISVETDRDNANVGNNFSAKLLRIGSEASKWYVTNALLPKEEVKPHENNEIYDHDLDSINLTINCLHIPTKRILDRGFNPGYGLIRKPKSIETAAMLSCIILQSSQNDMFGGQSHPNFDNDLSEYVMISRKKELSNLLIETFIASLKAEGVVALISDIIQEGFSAWDEFLLIKLEGVLKNNINYVNRLKDMYGVTQSCEEIMSIASTVLSYLIIVRDYIKDIPSQDDKTFWDEFISKWDAGIIPEELDINPMGLRGIDLKVKVEPVVYRSVRQAMQTVVYNLNTMHSRAGAQVPFSSINIGIPENPDAALICEVFLDEYNKGLGLGEQPIFPNIIFRVKSGVNREHTDPYYYLFKKACEVSAHRMNPTFLNLDSNYYKPYYDKGIIGAVMGCRTAVCSNINGKEGPEGRGNIAPATINLVRIGLCARQVYPNNTPEDEQKRIEYFFRVLQERLDMCAQKLMTRYNILKKLKVKDIPFSIGQGLTQGNEDMKMDLNDSIEPILKQGTYAVGFIGLAETLNCLVGSHHGESEKAYDLGLKIIKTIREFTDKQTKERQLNFGCYATPAEGLCGKLVKADRERFGSIPGVTDKEYYTNSYHIPVNYSISIMDKMKKEAPFQYLCNAGCISYIEFDGEPDGNTIIKIVTKTFKECPDMNYMAGNYHKRTCKDCGATVHNESNKCPNCGSHKIQGVSRVTGYLALDERFCPGKSSEKRDRIVHTM